MKPSRCFALAFFAAGVGLSAAGGQSGGAAARAQRFPLVEAVDAAVTHFPAVMASSARREAAEAAADRAAAAWWPSLTAGLAATRYEEPMLVSPIHGLTPGVAPAFDRTLLRGSVDLAYTLFDGGARAQRVREARELAAASGENLANARQEVTRSVVLTYLETLSRRSLLQAQESRIEALRAERDRIRQLMSADRASEVDMLRIDAALAGAEAERVQAESQLDLSRRDLARLAGVPVERVRPELLVAFRCKGTDPADRNSLVQEALGASTALQAARHELAAAEARLSLARSTRLPRADLAGTYAEYGSGDGDRSGEWNIGVRVTMPLFTGGQLSSGIDSAQAQARAAGESLRLAELQVSGQVDRAVSNLEAARARAESLAAAVSRSEKIVRIERLRLETGTGTQTDYLRAEADLLQAHSTLIEARHGELASRVELARLSGRLDRSWLSENLEAVQ